MRPVSWSQPPGDETVVARRESEEQALPAPPEWAPTESPGVFVEQPLERWSPRDLVVGIARLVRSTGAAIVRGVATS
jgi:hypothetical protein